MADERRYSDDEVRQIFALATRGDEGERSAVPPSDGLTLAELQAVGQEVGLSPEQVARAARSLDASMEVLPRGTTLGLPVSVGRVVELARNLTDREWELLVAELRTTFGARGVMTSHGGMREWSNGNLHALIEPTETGYRLRLGTMSSTAGLSFAFGGFLIAFATLLAIVVLAKGKPEGLVVPGFFSLMGLGAILRNVVSLPRWASRRERQMEHIADRVKALLGPDLPDDIPSGEAVR